MALNRSNHLAAKAVYHALSIIHTDGTLFSSNERAMHRSAILDELCRRNMTLFDDWELGLRSSRAPRWQEELLRHSSNYVNAGYLRKERGTWYLTSAGAAALSFGAEYMFDEACAAYESCRNQQRNAR